MKAAAAVAARADDDVTPTPDVAPTPTRASARTRAREVRVEQLLGRKVFDPSGEMVGRIEEICAEVDGGDHVVREFHVGRLAGVERLFGGRFMRAFLRRLSGDRIWAGYRVPWDDLDLSDPDRPRVRRKAAELEKLE